MKANQPVAAPTRQRRPRRQRLALHSAATSAILLLAASCAPPPPQQPPPPPPPAPAIRTQPTTAPVSNWQDSPFTPGNWRWSREGAQSLARFGQPGAPLLTLACHRDGARALIVLTRTGTPADGTPSPTLSIHAGAAARPIPAQTQAGAVTATLDSRDPLLDAMAFARGRFAVEVQGMPPLALPSWPEVARVIEDCR